MDTRQLRLSTLSSFHAFNAHTGTVFVSDTGRQLYLHQLSLTPKERISRIMEQQSPYPRGEGSDMMQHAVSATWAPDDTMVALTYSSEDCDDPDGDVFQVHTT